MLVAVMGIFKVEDGDKMHILILVNITLLGIRIRMWLERFVALLKREGKTNCPSFCDMEGYMLSSADIDSVFQTILEEI